MKLDNIRSIEKFIKEDKTYLIMGIVRNKDNKIPKCQRHKYKYIFKGINQFRLRVNMIEKLTEMNPELEFRIYISFNHRNIKQALKNFQKLLLDYSHNIDNDIKALDSASRLDSKWFSELAKDKNGNKEYQMFDVDVFDESINDYIREYFDVILEVPSKNGRHIVIESNHKVRHYWKNLRWFKDRDIELKKDDLILGGVI